MLNSFSFKETACTLWDKNDDDFSAVLAVFLASDRLDKPQQL
jgi:hypothetical protein